jgi:hypothetical protein
MVDFLVWFGILTSSYRTRYDVNKNCPKNVLTQVTTDVPFHNRKPILRGWKSSTTYLSNLSVNQGFLLIRKLNTMQNMFVVNTESRLSKLPTLYWWSNSPYKPMIYISTDIFIDQPCNNREPIWRVEAMASGFLRPPRKIPGFSLSYLTIKESKRFIKTLIINVDRFSLLQNTLQAIIKHSSYFPTFILYL